jgi:hypothetical protein
MVYVVNIVINSLLNNLMWEFFIGHFVWSVLIHEPIHHRYVTDRTELVILSVYC